MLITKQRPNVLQVALVANNHLALFANLYFCSQLIDKTSQDKE